MPKKNAAGLSSKIKILRILALVLLVVILGLPLVTLLILPKYRVTEGFKNLQQVETYTKAFDEQKIEMENTNLVKPDYTNFYTGQQKGLFAAKLQTLGLLKRLPWTAHTYKNYFEQRVKLGKEKNYTGNFAHKIVSAATSKIVVWGDIQGALHSLCRDLRELIKLGILGEDLKVTSPDNYLIFLGDVTSRSPFLMETLSLVARLLLNNPENLFYIRGNHESSNYWQGYGLKTELKIRAASLAKSEEQLPLEQLTNDFFDTLPTVLYLGTNGNPEKQFIRLSHEGIDGESKIGEINDLKMAPFLSTKIASGKLATLNYKDLKEGTATQPIEVKALLKSEVKRKTYQSMDGLRLTSPENGITAWTMLSCPTEVYRKGLEYFYDAFVIIQASAKIEDWTITLHNQDVRTLQGFKTRTLNLISGQLLDGAPAPSAPAETQAEKPTPAAPALGAPTSAAATTSTTSPASPQSPSVTPATQTATVPMPTPPQDATAQPATVAPVAPGTQAPATSVAQIPATPTPPAQATQAPTVATPAHVASSPAALANPAAAPAVPVALIPTTPPATQPTAPAPENPASPAASVATMPVQASVIPAATVIAPQPPTPVAAATSPALAPTAVVAATTQAPAAQVPAPAITPPTAVAATVPPLPAAITAPAPAELTANKAALIQPPAEPVAVTPSLNTVISTAAAPSQAPATPPASDVSAAAAIPAAQTPTVQVAAPATIPPVPLQPVQQPPQAEVPTPVAAGAPAPPAATAGAITFKPQNS